MRINCAKCGEIHDSTVTPFLHDVVPGEAVPKDIGDYYFKEITANFTCAGCGALNELTIEQAVWEDTQ